MNTISANLLALINQAESDLAAAQAADADVLAKNQLVTNAQTGVGDAQKVVAVAQANANNLHQTAATSAGRALAQLKVELGIAP